MWGSSAIYRLPFEVFIIALLSLILRIKSFSPFILTSDNVVISTFLLQPGQSVMIQPSVNDEEAEKLFSKITVVALPSGNNYIRQTNV